MTMLWQQLCHPYVTTIATLKTQRLPQALHNHCHGIGKAGSNPE